MRASQLVLEYECVECGSDNLVFEGEVLWNKDSGKWEVTNVDISVAFCRPCNGQKDIMIFRS